MSQSRLPGHAVKTCWELLRRQIVMKRRAHGRSRNIFMFWLVPLKHQTIAAAHVDGLSVAMPANISCLKSNRFLSDLPVNLRSDASIRMHRELDVCLHVWFCYVWVVHHLSFIVKPLSLFHSPAGKAEAGGRMHVTLCDYIMPWDTLSNTQKKGLSQRYQMGCECKVSPRRTVCVCVCVIYPS